MAEKANIIPEKRQPYVGEAAFSHKAGQHADVISKAPELMEHVDGALVGNERRVLLSELAGKSTMVKKMLRYGDFEKSSEVVSRLLAELKELEEKGYEYEAAEASFDLIIRRALGLYKPLLELSNYHMENYKSGDTPAKTVGRIFVRVNGNVLMGAAVGAGPVDTLNGALRDALLPLHPFLKKLKLTDYRVRVLNPEKATAARVRVFITTSDGEHTWDTVGVDENIIEASWQALVDAVEYYYNNFVVEREAAAGCRVETNGADDRLPRGIPPARRKDRDRAWNHLPAAHAHGSCPHRLPQAGGTGAGHYCPTGRASTRMRL